MIISCIKFSQQRFLLNKRKISMSSKPLIAVWYRFLSKATYIAFNSMHCYHANNIADFLFWKNNNRKRLYNRQSLTNTILWTCFKQLNDPHFFVLWYFIIWYKHFISQRFTFVLFLYDSVTIQLCTSFPCGNMMIENNNLVLIAVNLSFVFFNFLNS